MADENGFTLLHHAVLKGQEGKVNQVVELADALQKPSKQEIQKWTNARTHKDQFTALHLASYRGNMDAVRALIAYGSDINAENYFGLNMVHVAAQGDQATTLYFFKSLGININKQDKRGSTPLHWACYSQSEIALTYLLAWNPELNLQDQEGLTPLHLAVRSVEQVESTRMVRFLMVRGANKNIPDNKGNLPADLIADIRSPNLARELSKMLGRGALCDCLMLKAQTRYIKRSSKTMMVYSLMFIFVLIVEVFWVFPSK